MTNVHLHYLDRATIARELELLPHLKVRAEQSWRNRDCQVLENVSQATILRVGILVLVLFWSSLAYGIYELF
jgi:hypothetical protein